MEGSSIQLESPNDSPTTHLDKTEFGQSGGNAGVMMGNAIQPYIYIAHGSTSKECDEDEFKNCLQCLYKADSHEERNLDRVEGTCEWFLEDEKYRRWWREQKSDLLWVSAGAGCGKSVLANFLVDELRSSKSQQIVPSTVCSFFFKDDNDYQKSAIFALCALLHQLFVVKRRLIYHAVEEFKVKNAAFTKDFATLWKILTMAATDKKNGGNVICIIDGLDECEPRTQKQLIESFIGFHQNLGTSSGNGPFLKFLVTSRPDSAIENGFHSLETIRLEDTPTTTCEDIKLVIKARIKSIGERERLSKDLQDNLVRRLFDEAEQTFLWVSLVLKMIDDSANFNQETLNEILSTRPTTLDEIYEKIFTQCPKTKMARKTLHIIIAAARPLSLDEINVASSIKHGNRSFESVDRSPFVENMLKKNCRSFLRIQDSKVYLVHQTAKDFLIKKYIPDPLFAISFV
ncbi:hypothetical protein K469DRAFT_740762 [Zopfia rhizophila CBS 207.26]|uniref:Uncharacterized protein n=1 Tax=Zopfia rhizophila CBS 207.26 TaxID=1314779 RepID=A0A6A6DPE6_9PEZI|nr:hypothetical protein K469DRAFT_740762 [Zopfia rhizophila CBS 207.26]